MKFNAKLLFIIIIVIVLVAAVVFVVVGSHKNTSQITGTAATAAETPTPTSTVDPSTYADIDVPDGITIVQAPESASDTYVGSNSSTGSTSSSNNNIYIVDGPSDATSSSSNSGIYIVNTPTGNSSGNNIYIVDGPSDDGSSSGGSTIRSGNFSGSNGGLTINVSYSVVTVNSSTCKVIMDASLTHGNLNANSNMVTFNCYGQYGTVGAPSISGSGTTYLGQKTFTINLAKGESTTMNLSGSWRFNGTYSGNYIDAVTATTSATVSR